MPMEKSKIIFLFFLPLLVYNIEMTEKVFFGGKNDLLFYRT